MHRPTHRGAYRAKAQRGLGMDKGPPSHLGHRRTGSRGYGCRTKHKPGFFCGHVHLRGSRRSDRQCGEDASTPVVSSKRRVPRYREPRVGPRAVLRDGSVDKTVRALILRIALRAGEPRL